MASRARPSKPKKQPAAEPKAEPAAEPKAEAEPAAEAPQKPEPVRPRFTCVAPTKQPAELCCITCGAFLGTDRPLVRTVTAAMRLDFARERKCRIEFAAQLPGSAPVIGALLDALGYTRVCCRAHLLTEYPHAGIVEPPLADMEMSGK